MGEMVGRDRRKVEYEGLLLDFTSRSSFTNRVDKVGSHEKSRFRFIDSFSKNNKSWRASFTEKYRIAFEKMDVNTLQETF